MAALGNDEDAIIGLGLQVESKWEGQMIIFSEGKKFLPPTRALSDKRGRPGKGLIFK